MTEDKPDKLDQKVPTLPTWRVILDMIRYRWQLWALNLAFMLVLTAAWQIPGFIMREFFRTCLRIPLAGYAFQP